MPQDEIRGGKCDAPARAVGPFVENVLSSRAKTYRKLAADFEELADAISSRRELTIEQKELLGSFVSAGMDHLLAPSSLRRYNL